MVEKRNVLMTHKSELKEILKLSHSGQNQRQASDYESAHMKTLCQGRH